MSILAPKKDSAGQEKTGDAMLGGGRNGLVDLTTPIQNLLASGNNSQPQK